MAISHQRSARVHYGNCMCSSFESRKSRRTLRTRIFGELCVKYRGKSGLEILPTRSRELESKRSGIGIPSYQDGEPGSGGSSYGSKML